MRGVTIVVVGLAMTGAVAPLAAASGPMWGIPCDDFEPLLDVQVGVLSAAEPEAWFEDRDAGPGQPYVLAASGGVAEVSVYAARAPAWIGWQCYHPACHAMTGPADPGVAACTAPTFGTFWIHVTLVEASAPRVAFVLAAPGADPPLAGV